MKINGSELPSTLNIYQTARVQGPILETANLKKPEGPTPQQDRVALTERGRAIADAQWAMASIPDVREPLVSQIRTDLQYGVYGIDNQKAAEGILRESMLNQAAMF